VRLALVFLMAATAAVAADRSFSSPSAVLGLGFSSDGKSVVGVCKDGVVRFEGRRVHILASRN